MSGSIVVEYPVTVMKKMDLVKEILALTERIEKLEEKLKSKENASILNDGTVVFNGLGINLDMYDGKVHTIPCLGSNTSLTKEDLIANGIIATGF